MLLVLFLSACGGSDNGKAGTTIDSSVDDADTEAGEERHETTRKIFERVPSPVESASLLRKAGASYDMTILNPIENVSGYETIKAKALNLGIYSTDLSYASMFEQTQEIMVYSSCAKKLSDGLGITEAYDEKTLERIENNLADKDSILERSAALRPCVTAFVSEPMEPTSTPLMTRSPFESPIPAFGATPVTEFDAVADTPVCAVTALMAVAFAVAI